MFRCGYRVAVALLVVGALAASPCCFCSGKEITLAKEWQLVGTNDTIPAGAHIRMDMTTGEKWVKLLDDEDEKSGDDTNPNSEVDVDSAGQISSATSTAAVMVSDPKEQTIEMESPQTEEPEYDFDMMYRTLSSLPPDEKERMGGIPELPASATRTRDLSQKDREIFEKRMKEIWEQRQEDLARLEDELMMDLPEVLKDRIGRIQEYIHDPFSHLSQLSSRREHDYIGNDGEEEDDDVALTDIDAVLRDLEFQLTDIDMTRDFHTLGGWPLLVSLLSDETHKSSNQTMTSELLRAVQIVQADAAWVVGTAVKNTAEFFPFAVEPVVLGSDQATTVLDLLLYQFHKIDKDHDPLDKYVAKKRQRALYALGSLLRGNRWAQQHFVSIEGPSVLADDLQSFCQQQNAGAANIAKKVLALAGDIIDDVKLHSDKPSNDEVVITDAFSTERFCLSALQCLDSGFTRETALRTVQTLTPHCSWKKETAVAAIQRAKDMWRANQGMDQEILRELFDLSSSTQDMIKSRQACCFMYCITPVSLLCSLSPGN